VDDSGASLDVECFVFDDGCANGYCYVHVAVVAPVAYGAGVDSSFGGL